MQKDITLCVEIKFMLLKLDEDKKVQDISFEGQGCDFNGFFYYD